MLITPPHLAAQRGGPLATIQGPDGLLVQFLRDLGPHLLAKYRPKAIVILSAHWETPGGGVTTDYGAENPLLYDYFGFDKASVLLSSSLSSSSSRKLTLGTSQAVRGRVQVARRPPSRRARRRAPPSCRDQVVAAHEQSRGSRRRRPRLPRTRTRCVSLSLALPDLVDPADEPLAASQTTASSSRSSTCSTAQRPSRSSRYRSRPTFAPRRSTLSASRSPRSVARASSSSRAGSRSTRSATLAHSRPTRPSRSTARGRRTSSTRSQSRRCALTASHKPRSDPS